MELSFKILDVLVNWQIKGKKVSAKIGVHTGKVVAGVIGDPEYKPQFSLIGDTVNTSARMCSEGITNQIHISSFP